MIRDLHTGIEATRLMALIMLVLSVSPILAPLVGSILSAAFGWRTIFAAVAAVVTDGVPRFVGRSRNTPASEKNVRVAVSRLYQDFATPRH